MGLTVTAYARHRAERGLKGQTHVAVIKALQAGRIVREPDGTIDPDKADAAWGANTDPSQQRARVRQREAPAPPAPQPDARPNLSAERQSPTPPRPAPVREPPPMSQPEPAPDRSNAAGPKAPSYADSRAIREAYNARIAKLDYEERTGQLVRTDRVKIAWFDVMRVVRDRLLNLPARLSARLAAETDERVIRTLLDEEMRTALNDAANAVKDYQK